MSCHSKSSFEGRPHSASDADFGLQGFGFAKHWTTLIGLRIVLGILEGGLFPGVIYLISLYYTRCTSFPGSGFPC
jgi:hypothetical protein